MISMYDIVARGFISRQQAFGKRFITELFNRSAAPDSSGAGVDVDGYVVSATVHCPERVRTTFALPHPDPVIT